MYELLVVGAGPHALSVICRLLEENPDASVDAYEREVRPKAELRRLWARQAGCAQRRARLLAWLRDRVLVVDPHGRWMARWDEQFTGLNIEHLRSPSSIHPDPCSSYALEMWAQDRQRACELHGMEAMDKSADFRGPFELPGTRLFADFCREVVRRYCLDEPGVVQQGMVESLEVIRAPCGAYSHCNATILCSGDAGCGILDCHIHYPHPHQPDQVLGTGPCPHQGQQQLHGGSGCSSGGGGVCRVCVQARRVLLAVGSTNVPRLPAFAAEWVEPTPGTPAAPLVGCQGEQQQQQSQPRSSPSTAPVSQTTAQPCQQTRTSSTTTASLPASPLPAPKPWAGRMLHAWQVAAAFANRQNRPSSQQQQQHSCELPSDPTQHLSSSTNSSSSSRSRKGGGHRAAAAGDRKAGGAAAEAGGRSHGGGSGLLAGQRVVVVGGGLTAAQLAALAARHGCRDVVLLARREMQVKQFDVDVKFLGRMRMAHLKAFSRTGAPAGAAAAAAAAAAADAGSGPKVVKRQQQHQQQVPTPASAQPSTDSGNSSSAAVSDASASSSPLSSRTPSTSRGSSGSGMSTTEGTSPGGSASASDTEDTAGTSAGSSAARTGDGVADGSMCYKVAAAPLLVAATPQQPDGPQQRLALLRAAVGGGSVTPEAVRQVRQLVAQGVLRVEEGVEVLAADWEGARECGAAGDAGCGLAVGAGEVLQQQQQQQQQTQQEGMAVGQAGLPGGGRWVLYLSRQVSLRGSRVQGGGRWGSGAGGAKSEGQEEEEEEGYELRADHVWCATGSVVDAGRDPLLAALAAGGCKGDTCGGLPVLTPELRWAEGVDVFVSGAYAALQLGPGAGNLAGARTAAVRLVDLWRREPDGALDITRTAAKGTCGGADAACGACTGSTVASGGTAEVWPVAGGMEKAGAGPGKPVGSVVMSTAVGRGGKGARMVGRGRRQAGMAGGGGRRVEEGQVCDMA